ARHRRRQSRAPSRQRYRRVVGTLSDERVAARGGAVSDEAFTVACASDRNDPRTCAGSRERPPAVPRPERGHRARTTRPDGRGRAEDNRPCSSPTANLRAAVALRPWTTTHGEPGQPSARLTTAPTGPATSLSFFLGEIPA